MKIKNTFSIALIICGVALAAWEVFFSVLAGQSLNVDGTEFLSLVGSSLINAVIIILATYAVAQFLNFMYIIAKAHSKEDNNEEEKTKN